MLISAVQVLAGFGVLAEHQLARRVGVAPAAVNAVAQLLSSRPIYPGRWRCSTPRHPGDARTARQREPYAAPRLDDR